MTATYGALFDLDGVIIDSESRYTLFWAEIENIYPTGIPDYPIAIKGTTLETILNNYPDEAVRRDIVDRLMRFQDIMPMELYPGALEFLESLRQSGVGMALVTSSDSRKVDILFGHHPELRQFFTAVIDGSKVTRSKPDPQGYHMGAKAIGIVPERCCVFEDSLQGLMAGRAAGGKVVGVATTYPAERIAPMADIVVPTIAGFSASRLAAMFGE